MSLKYFWSISTTVALKLWPGVLQWFVLSPLMCPFLPLLVCWWRDSSRSNHRLWWTSPWVRQKNKNNRLSSLLYSLSTVNSQELYITDDPSGPVTALHYAGKDSSKVMLTLQLPPHRFGLHGLRPQWLANGDRLHQRISGSSLTHREHLL